MKTKLPLLLAASVCAALLLVACGGGATNSANGGNTAASNAAASNAAASNTSTASGDKIGVPECDDYIAKWEACVNSKVPEAQRGTFKGAFETTRSSWRQLASTAQGKAGLAQACKAAHEQAKQAFGSYGCSW